MKTKKLIISALYGAVIVLLAACSGDELASGVQEGLPVSLQLQVAVPEQETVAMTRATDEAETKIEKLALVFYKKNVVSTYKPVVIELGSDQLGTPTQESLTHYKYTVTLSSDELKNLTTSKGSGDEGLLSGEWYLYAIANYDKQYVSITLDQIKGMTKAEMDDYQTRGSTEQDFVESAVLMSGKYGTDGSITLNAGENSLTGDPFLTLRRTVSKNIFTFKAADGITFTPTSYTLHNYSSTSTLFERDTRTTTGGYNIGKYDDDKEVKESTSDIAISGDTITFYTQENAQKAKSDPSPDSWTYNAREAHVSATDQSFKYAPSKGTYVVVKGTYEGPISSTNTTRVKGDVTYTIHLGDFSKANGSSYSNFSVLRNVKYTYTVTVKGVNNIVVEAQASDFTEKQPGAEGHLVAQNAQTDVTLDAHYEQVLLSFDAPKDDATYNVTINTPYTNKTIKIDNLSDENDDYKWIEFAKPATATTFNSYTTLKKNNTLGTLKDLVSDLKEHTSVDGKYFLRDNNKIYVAAYVNEYYYTNSNDAKNAGDLDYWADCKGLSDFVNADPREMTLTIGTVYTSKDEKSSYTTDALFTIKQRSIKCPFSLAFDNPFGIETVEETNAAKINKDNENSYTVSDELHGWQNYTSCGAFTTGSSSWSTYINESKNGWIGGEFDKSQVMKDDYNYAIYQCLSRNRDLDGDGVIDADEIRWYLPAHKQCLYLWFGENSLPDEARFIETTTSEKTTKVRHYLTSTLSTASNSANWWVDEGSAFSNNDNSKTYTYSVRAVRSLGDADGKCTDIAEYDANSRTITVSGLNDNCMRTGVISGNYQSHERGTQPDMLYKKIKFADNTIKVGDFGSDKGETELENLLDGNISDVESYTEQGEAETTPKWRIPNEKELALVELFYSSNMKAGEAAISSYTDTDGKERGYFYNGKNITTLYYTDKWVSFTMQVRPVRDVTTSSTSAKRHRK